MHGALELAFVPVPQRSRLEPFALVEQLSLVCCPDNEPLVMFVHEVEQIIHIIVPVKDIGGIREPGKGLHKGLVDHIVDGSKFLISRGVDAGKQTEWLTRMMAQGSHFGDMVSLLNFVHGG